MGEGKILHLHAKGATNTKVYAPSGGTLPVKNLVATLMMGCTAEPVCLGSNTEITNGSRGTVCLNERLRRPLS